MSKCYQHKQIMLGKFCTIKTDIKSHSLDFKVQMQRDESTHAHDPGSTAFRHDTEDEGREQGLNQDLDSGPGSGLEGHHQISFLGAIRMVLIPRPCWVILWPSSSGRLNQNVHNWQKNFRTSFFVPVLK